MRTLERTVGRRPKRLAFDQRPSYLAFADGVSRSHLGGGVRRSLRVENLRQSLKKEHRPRAGIGRAVAGDDDVDSTGSCGINAGQCLLVSLQFVDAFGPVRHEFHDHLGIPLEVASELTIGKEVSELIREDILVA
jgi:hypothetical protein